MFHVKHYSLSTLSSSKTSSACLANTVTDVTICLSFRCINLTPWVFLLKVETLLTSSLITVPSSVVMIISSSPETDLNATIKPFLSVILRALTPLLPRWVKRYSLTSVFLPYPFSPFKEN